jgi:hypothetical protein
VGSENFDVISRVFGVIVRRMISSRFFHFLLRVPIPIVIRWSLDNPVLKKDNLENAVFVKQAEQRSHRHQSKLKTDCRSCQKKPARNEASRNGKLAANSQNQNMENLCGT